MFFLFYSLQKQFEQSKAYDDLIKDMDWATVQKYHPPERYIEHLRPKGWVWKDPDAPQRYIANIF